MEIVTIVEYPKTSHFIGQRVWGQWAGLHMPVERY